MRRLKEGGKIGIISLAGPPDREKLIKGIEELEERGYRVIVGESNYQRWGYLAGRDEFRFREFLEFYFDDTIDLIISSRGGYGSIRLLRYLEEKKYNLKDREKLIMGYSDITAFLIAIHQLSGKIVFHGPMVSTDLAKGWFTRKESDSWQLLCKEVSGYKLFSANSGDSFRVLKGGKVSGKLIGGCLSILVNLIGTPFLTELEDKILFFEDIGEDPYRIDRMLHHLYYAGVFKKVKGVLMGHFSDCYPRDEEPSLSLDEIFEDFFKDYDRPVIRDLPFGHGEPNKIIPIGAFAEINTETGEILISTE